MSLIARCGFLLLSALVLFAFLEVRYDTLRPREKVPVSVNSRPTAFFRALRSEAIPCAPLSRPVPLCRVLSVKGGMRVRSTKY